MAIIVIVTIPQKNANALTTILLQKKLCACVNLIKGIQSFFWWKNKINHASETILLIKTKKSLFQKLKKTIQKHHPYTVPEIIAVKISHINKEYLQWLNTETNG